jgi:uncharacterized protein
MAERANKLTRILSIDGGGIRGIIPGQILVSLEEKLKKRTKNPDARIADHFDLIAGTSTGGILTCAYLCPDSNDPAKTNRPKFNAQQVVNLYLERGHDIFNVPFKHKIKSAGGLVDEKYPAAAIEKALNDYFGDTKLSQLIKPCLITAYDIKRRQGHFFNQVDAAQDEGWNYLVKEVARATSAAPTYFECSEIKSLTGVTYPLIDGGVFVNNPTLCAYAEVHNKFNKTAKEMAILSIGTGFTRKEYDYNSAKDWGLAAWVKPLIDIMMAGVADVVDYQLKQIYHAVGTPQQYVRINQVLPIGVNPDMDDASTENLNALKELGTETAQIFNRQLDEFVELIV